MQNSVLCKYLIDIDVITVFGPKPENVLSAKDGIYWSIMTFPVGLSHKIEERSSGTLLKGFTL